jgi:hypothetical protein
MAVNISNTFDSIADATALTSANIVSATGTSGNAAASINLGSASTVTAKTSALDHGARGLEFSFGNSGAGDTGATRILWAASSPVGDRIVWSFYVNYSAAVTVFEDVGGILSSTSTKVLVASIGTDGKLIIADASGTYLSASRAPNIFPTGWCRVDLAIAPGSTTTNGYVGYAYYVGDAASATYTWNNGGTGNAGANLPVGQVFIGRTTSRAAARVVKYDTIRAQAPITAPAFLDPFVTTGGSSGSVTQDGINTAEGIPLGTVLTSTSTGLTGGASGNAANTIAVGTASDITVSNFNVSHGSRGYALDLGSSAGSPADSGATRIMWTHTRTDRAVGSWYMGSITQSVTALEDLGGFRNSTGNIAYLQIGTDGKAIMSDSAGSITASRSTAVVPIDTRIRFDISVRPGTGTSDGLLGYAYFLSDSDTPTFAWEESTHNTGTTAEALVFIGRTTSRGEVISLYYDTVRWGHSGATLNTWFQHYVPPPQAPTAAVANIINDIEPFSTVTIDATGSADPNGEALTFTLTQTAGPAVTPSGSGPLWTYQAPAKPTAQQLVWSVTCTNTDSLTSAPASATHNVLPWDVYGPGPTVPIRTMVVR